MDIMADILADDRRHMDIMAEKLADRQADILTSRQTYLQTDKGAETISRLIRVDRLAPGGGGFLTCSLSVIAEYHAMVGGEGGG